MGFFVNGIYHFEESDDAAPLSDLLNNLSESVSDTVEQLVVAAGPTAVTGDPAVATSTIQVERVGRLVEANGIITPVTNWGAINALVTPVVPGGIPSIYRPSASRIFTVPSQGGTATVTWRLTINTDGSIQVRCNTATSTSAIHVALGWFAPPV